MHPERVAKLRRTAEWHLRDDKASNSVHALATGLLEALAELTTPSPTLLRQNMTARLDEYEEAPRTLVPLFDDPNHDMRKGPCRCGVWH